MLTVYTDEALRNELDRRKQEREREPHTISFTCVCDYTVKRDVPRPHHFTNWRHTCECGRKWMISGRQE